MQEDGEDGFTTELISQAKQSRSEKKARKALCKLGKPIYRLSLNFIAAFLYTCEINEIL